MMSGGDQMALKGLGGVCVCRGGYLPEVGDVFVIIIRLREHDCCLRQWPEHSLQVGERGSSNGGAAAVPANHLMQKGDCDEQGKGGRERVRVGGGGGVVPVVRAAGLGTCS
jgi:hypothetical protein